MRYLRVEYCCFHDSASLRRGLQAVARPKAAGFSLGSIMKLSVAKKIELRSELQRRHKVSRANGDSCGLPFNVLGGWFV